MSLAGVLARKACAALAAALALGLAAPALAASVFTVTITSPNLGTFISGASGDSLFHIDSNTGAVTQTSGTAIRTTSGPGRATDDAQVFGDRVDADSDWPIDFWVGGWDADAFCMYMRGRLSLPLV